MQEPSQEPFDGSQQEEVDATLSGASWIPVIQPHLKPDLVGSRQLERVRSIAQYLPEDALYALETRLASTSCQVDLSARVNRPAAARHLATYLPSGPRRRFLESWARQPTAEGPSIPSLWLEFDLADLGSTSLPEPVLCVRFPSQPSTPWLLEEVLPRLCGRELSPALRRNVLHCLKNLPPATKLLYVFDLSVRMRGRIRLELYSEELSPLLTFLQQGVSAGAAAQIAALTPLAGDGDRYHLSIDLEESSVSERIGLEISYRRLPHREPRWHTLFDRLADAGLCTSAEREAMFDWLGEDTAHSAKGWPAGAGGHCVRCLSHVKLLTWPNRPPRAKGYLLFQHLRGSPKAGTREHRARSLTPTLLPDRGRGE